MFDLLESISVDARPKALTSDRSGGIHEPSQESKAVDELRKKVKAMTSETESYRRRLEDSAKAARGKGREDVFKALMPIMDAMEMALKSAEGSSAQTDQLTKGIELVHKQLKTDLGLLGLPAFSTRASPSSCCSPPRLHADPTCHGWVLSSWRLRLYSVAR